MAIIEGICPIIATPFTNTGEVDYDSFQNLLRVLVKGGCPGLTLFGIAGEYYKLNGEERSRMMRLFIDGCRTGRAASIVSITDHATECAVQQARRAEEAGADCLMVLPPFFLKPSVADLCQHVRLVAQAAGIPTMVQYAPEQTGVAVPPDVLAGLSREAENIKYFKIECKPLGAYISALLALRRKDAGVFIGNAGLQLPEALDRGASGAMPGCSMFEIYLRIYKSYVEDRRAEAFRLHNSLLPLLNHIRQSVEMIIAFEKRILKKRGIIQTDYCRMPAFVPDTIDCRLFEEYYAGITCYLAAGSLPGADQQRAAAGH